MSRIKHEVVKVVVNEQRIHTLRVAQTFRQRLLGWGLRNRCDGVWLLPCRAVHTIGMCEPIGLLWLDKNGQLQHVDHLIVPNRVIRYGAAYSVIELPSAVLPTKVHSIKLVTQGCVT